MRFIRFLVPSILLLMGAGWLWSDDINPFIRMIDGIEFRSMTRFDITKALILTDESFPDIVRISADEIRIAAPIYTLGKHLILQARKIIFEGDGSRIVVFDKPAPTGLDGKTGATGRPGKNDQRISYLLEPITEESKILVEWREIMDLAKQRIPKPTGRFELFLVDRLKYRNIRLIDEFGHYTTHPVTGVPLFDSETATFPMSRDKTADITKQFLNFYYSDIQVGKVGPHFITLTTVREAREDRGEEGGVGDTGEEGGLGNAGRDAGTIEIYAGELIGNVAIDGVGQMGGTGGRGGKGGQGGLGGKGADGKADTFAGFGGRHPTRGGFGGQGGVGGRGGSGGQGGRGANVVIAVANDFDSSHILVDGGRPGSGGPGGDGGPGGSPGVGGSRGAWVFGANDPESESGGQMGKGGSPGGEGIQGAQAGERGALKVLATKDLELRRQRSVREWKLFHLVRTFRVLYERSLEMLHDREASLKWDDQESKLLKDSWLHIDKSLRSMDSGSAALLSVMSLLNSMVGRVLSAFDNSQRQDFSDFEADQNQLFDLSLQRVVAGCQEYLDSLQKFSQNPIADNLQSRAYFLSKHLQLPACHKVSSFIDHPFQTIEIQASIASVLDPFDLLRPYLKEEAAHPYSDAFKNPFSAWLRLGNFTAFAVDAVGDVSSAFVPPLHFGNGADRVVSMRHLQDPFFRDDALVSGGLVVALHALSESQIRSTLDFSILAGLFVNDFQAVVKRAGTAK